MVAFESGSKQIKRMQKKHSIVALKLETLLMIDRILLLISTFNTINFDFVAQQFDASQKTHITYFIAFS